MIETFKAAQPKRRRTLIFIVTALFIFAALLFGWGSAGIMRTASRVAKANQLRLDLLQVEIDHCYWMSEINRVLSEADLNGIPTEPSAQTCPFTQWSAGKGRTQALDLVPKLAPRLTVLNGVHDALHVAVDAVLSEARAGRIEEAQRQFNGGCKALMEDLQQELTGARTEIDAAFTGESNILEAATLLRKGVTWIGAILCAMGLAFIICYPIRTRKGILGDNIVPHASSEPQPPKSE